MQDIARLREDIDFIFEWQYKPKENMNIHIIIIEEALTVNGRVEFSWQIFD